MNIILNMGFGFAFGLKGFGLARVYCNKNANENRISTLLLTMFAQLKKGVSASPDIFDKFWLILLLCHEIVCIPIKSIVNEQSIGGSVMGGGGGHFRHMPSLYRGGHTH